MATGSQQRVVLHVGLPKTGTTYVQGLLAEQREELRAGGVLYPFLRPGGMFHAAVEVRGSHEKFGLDAAQIAGSWAALCARAREHPGTTVISHEILGGADTDEIAAALAPLDGLETHVVVTARELGRQATAHWQEEVKLGDTRSFADFEAEQFRADLPPGDDRRATALLACPGLRRGPAPLVERGAGRARPPGRLPASDGARRGSCGDASRTPPASTQGWSIPERVPPQAVNASLGRGEIAVLRAVNASLDGALPAAGLLARGQAGPGRAGAGPAGR